jgi:hypothetical protein
LTTQLKISLSRRRNDGKGEDMDSRSGSRKVFSRMLSMSYWTRLEDNTDIQSRKRWISSWHPKGNQRENFSSPD